MKNILKVFSLDVKRLATNVVAVVVLIGLSVIPSLYAWFNILSNWNPYGEDATKNLHVAVASEDEGTSFDTLELNIGNIVISNLKENNTIGWVFYDTKDDAVDSVNSGDCYAALVIDETFSEDMISFLGGDLEHPKIDYYENEKKNAIAPKITGKVKTTVQEEVNHAFVGTMAEVMLEASAYVATNDEDGNLTSTALEKLYRLQSDMQTYILILGSYISLVDSANSLMEASEAVTDQMDAVMESGRNTANSVRSATEAASNSVENVSDMVTNNLDQTNQQLDVFYKSMEEFIHLVEEAGKITNEQIDSMQLALNSISSAFTASMTTVEGKYTTQVDAQIETVNQDFAQINQDLENMKTATTITTQDARSIWERNEALIRQCQQNIQQLKDTYQTAVKPSLKISISSIQNSVSEVERLLNYSSDSIKDIAGCLDSYPDMMTMGRESLVSSKGEATEMLADLNQLIADMEELETNDQYKMLMKLIETDPEIIADFISSPVNLETVQIYAMENNGSASAPFYIVLSIWVGALILVAIVHTKIHPIKGIQSLKTYEAFFGRYLIFFLIGQVQTLITVLGSLLYVDIQCKNPFLFWLAASVCSFTFTLFLYSLTFAFGNVGEAVAVVLMVIQVAGSGGTFPVEVLPKVYQMIYEYMPFAHGMNAMRETIGGRYGNDYWIYLSGLLIYIVASLVIGLCISKPCQKLNRLVEESKEKTDLMK